MSGNYIPLYRKYRPQTLETLVGQEHIKKTLTSAIELGKISHAYLFTGPRGTGKTSTARILAKSLNCKNGPTIHPCGECESCKDITNSIPLDVIEIDAASNRKVEDAQNILEKIQYVPVNGKYKIYIIDEVHMLSTHAFNALLKTLEEPPENVIFILATTEVHKVLDTIKSRCQRYDFRRITTADIVKHLRYISNEEKIKISDEALFAIAKNSAGGMRDSISLLDQLSILGVSEEITVNDVNSILGRISFDLLFELTEKIISSSPSDAIQIINNIYNSGNEPLQILTNLNEYFKNLLVSRTCSKNLLPELTGLNEPQIDEILKQTEKLETQQIVFLIERISYYIKEVKLAVNQHLWLEVGIIDLANMTENSTLLNLQNRIRALESGTTTTEKIHTQTVVTKPAPIQPASQKNEIAEKIAEDNTPAENKTDDFTPPPVSKKSDGKDVLSMWQALLANISSPPTQAMLKLATPIQISEDGIIISFKNERFVSQINDSNKKHIIQEAAEKLFEGKDVTVTVCSAESSAPITEKKTENKVVNTNPQPLETKKGSAEKTENFPLEKKTSMPETSNDLKPEVQPTSKNIQRNDTKRTETDQEKMILDLFEGKYVE